MSNVPPHMTSYSTWLKLKGCVYMSLPVAAYFVKIGLAWHDAGEPFSFTGVKFHPYWNMILGPWYVMLGLCLFVASADPAAHKLLLSYDMWGCTSSLPSRRPAPNSTAS